MNKIKHFIVKLKQRLGILDSGAKINGFEYNPFYRCLLVNYVYFSNVLEFGTICIPMDNCTTDGDCPICMNPVKKLDIMISDPTIMERDPNFLKELAADLPRYINISSM